MKDSEYYMGALAHMETAISFVLTACVCVCVCVCVLWLCICVLLAVARHLGIAISVFSAAPLCKRMCDCVMVSILLYACHRRHGAVCAHACARVCGNVSACATVWLLFRDPSSLPRIEPISHCD